MDTYTSLMKMNSDLINLIDDYVKLTIKGYEKCRREFVRDVFMNNDYFTYLTFTKSKDDIYYVTKIEFRNWTNGNIIAIYTSREPNIYGYPDWYVSYTIKTDENIHNHCDDLLKLLHDQILYLYSKSKDDMSNVSMNDLIKSINAYIEYKHKENDKLEFIDNLHYHNSSIEFGENNIVRISIDNGLFDIIIYDNQVIIKNNNSNINSDNNDLSFITVFKDKKFYKCFDDEDSYKNHIINILLELYKYINDLLN